MTKVEIFRKKNNIVGYKAYGHSGYDEYGKDIICAAISSTMQMTLAGLQEILKLNIDFKIDENAFLEFYIKEQDMVNFKKEISVLMQSLYIFLKELEKEYPKFIKLVEKEEK